MAITNTSKPTTTLTNTARISSSELWSTITTTWATETRTWEECLSLVTNSSKQSTSLTNIAKP